MQAPDPIRGLPIFQGAQMPDKQNFEVSTWADAEVTPGPAHEDHPDHAAWLAEQTQDDEQADRPETEQEPK